MDLDDERDFEFVVRKRLGIDVDADLELRILPWRFQHGRRSRIFEGEVLDVLPEHIELRLSRRTLGRFWPSCSAVFSGSSGFFAMGSATRLVWRCRLPIMDAQCQQLRQEIGRKRL